MRKKIFLGLIAFAALTVTGCSNDEVVMQSPEMDKAIEFGTYVGRDAVSRGSVHTVATLAGTTDAPGPGFGVFAYYTNESDYVASSVSATDEGGTSQSASPCNFMYNQQVEGSGTTGEGDDAVTTYTWSYSPIKYWPNDPGDKLTFFAYAPYDDADETATTTGGVDNIKFNSQTEMNGDPVITFTVNNTVKNQTDLLFSKADNKNLVKNPSTGTGKNVTDEVEFEFAHALSRIGFTVKAVTDEVTAEATNPEPLDENTMIVVKKVILSGAAGTGDAEPTTGIFYTKGELNLNQQGVNTEEDSNYKEVSWTNIVGDDTNDAKQLFTLSNENFVEQTEATEDSGASVAAGGESTTTLSVFGLCNAQGFVITGGVSGNSTEANKLNADDSYIMIIPQKFGDYDDDQNNNNQLYVYVEYDVITQDSNVGNPTTNTDYDGLKSKVTNHISTSLCINFQSGKAYSLNLQLGMTSVKVTAKVDDWSEVTSGTAVDLPKNTAAEEESDTDA